MEKIDNRSQMLYAVTEVAMLEHSLMCHYLHAASTLKTNPKEFMNDARRFHQAELVRDWKRSLLIVAREEMQHLTYAINLLISIGGTGYFNRPNFPVDNRFYKGSEGGKGLMSLEKVTLDTIKAFVNFEAPPEKEKDFDLIAESIPEPNAYQTLNDFYTAIKVGLKESYFIGVKNELDPIDENGENIRVKGRKNVAALVTSPQDAAALIDQILEEGEGSSSTDEQAHHARFTKIADEWEEERRLDPDFDPSRNILPNTMTRIHDDHDTSLWNLVTVIEKGNDVNPHLPYNILQLFNGAYEILLTWLHQVFNRQGTKEELFAIQTLAFVPYMTEIIRPLMEILTRIPVDVNENSGFLSATFEVTSNNFIVPKEEITLRLTEERLDDLISLSGTVLQQLKMMDPDVAADFEFIQGSLVELSGEFRSRLKYGWPPPLDASNLFSEKPNGLWETVHPKLLELKFEGWVQTRLASDPDGANEKRGITGNNFAIGDEPDLDRIIHFQSNPKIIERSYTKPISVKVVQATILRAGLNTGEGETFEPFIGASIDLLGDPKFEGRNHIVSEDGEPVDPFTLCISTPGNSRFTRSVIGNNRINAMTGVERRGSGRFPVGMMAGEKGLQVNLSRIGDIGDPREYFAYRKLKLDSELSKIEDDDKISAEAEKLKFRSKFVESMLDVADNPGGRLFVRWRRLQFLAAYHHTISGDMLIQPEEDFGFKFVERTEDFNSKWLITYNFGFYDSDALASFVDGVIRIPIQ